MLEGFILNRFIERNVTHQKLLVFHLGERGFYAEFTSVARAMLYAWKHDLQLVLKSDEFSYKYRAGWLDYFQGFCKEYHPDMEPRVCIHARFGLHSDPGYRPLNPTAEFQVVNQFLTRELEIDYITLHGNRNILRVLSAAIFRLTLETANSVHTIIEQLELPESYAALHIRRGDKVGDEDRLYSCQSYVEQLADLDQISAIFVMTDDYAVVLELENYLDQIGQKKRLYTLCTQSHTGYDVWKMRKRVLFFGEGEQSINDESYKRYVYEETLRLLAETLVAKDSSNFVSSQRSNVGIVVSFLHSNPAMCAAIN